MADEGGEGGDGAGEGGDGKPSEEGKAPDKGNDPDDDKPLGPAGQKALETERSERKALKAELDSFKSALGDALGIKPEADKGDDQADLIASVQKQLKDMQHKSAVLELANTHRITDADDLALLASATDAEAMKRLAERLAPGDESTDDKPKSGRRPKPDLTQGGGSGDGEPDTGVGAGRDLFKASRKTK
jgi:hypothetical protein